MAFLDNAGVARLWKRISARLDKTEENITDLNNALYSRANAQDVVDLEARVAAIENVLNSNNILVADDSSN